MHPWSRALAGRIDEHVFVSDALRDNPLGDPHERPLWVYVPPGYDKEMNRRYPTIVVIQGYTGQLDMWRNRSAFRPNVIELTDQLFADTDVPPALIAHVDAWTSYGGSQFLDSPGTGQYHTYLCDEVVPWVDQHYRTLREREHRAIAGKSSGGYGAMVTAMLRPDLFGGFATHAGDSLFEVCYPRDFDVAARTLRDLYGGSYERFWEDFRSRPAFTRPGDAELVEAWGCSAAYSADADGTVQLPFDPATARRRDDVWERWLAWDPVRMAPRHADALRSMRAIWIDAGRRDEYFLDLGAEAFRSELVNLGLGEGVVHFELFDATHAQIEYRYPLALRYLSERLAP